MKPSSLILASLFLSLTGGCSKNNDEKNHDKTTSRSEAIGLAGTWAGEVSSLDQEGLACIPLLRVVEDQMALVASCKATEDLQEIKSGEVFVIVIFAGTFSLPDNNHFKLESVKHTCAGSQAGRTATFSIQDNTLNFPEKAQYYSKQKPSSHTASDEAKNAIQVGCLIKKDGVLTFEPHDEMKKTLLQL